MVTLITKFKNRREKTNHYQCQNSKIKHEMVVLRTQKGHLNVSVTKEHL